MILFLAQLTITAGLLLIVANIIKGIHIDGWGPALLAALILGLANACVRPLMILLTLPLTVLTFGLFLFVVNGVMLQLAGALTPGVRIDGCGSAILGSLLLAALNMAIAFVLGPALTTL